MTESPTPDPTLEAALEKARPAEPEGRGPAKATLALGGAVLTAAGFLGGYLVNGGDDASAAGPQFSGSGPTRIEGGPGGVNGDPGNITFGTVVSVDGTTVTVKTQDGKTVKVETSSDTDITVTDKGTVDDLAKGDTVVVNGETKDDKVTAESITEGGMRIGRGDGPKTSE